MPLGGCWRSGSNSPHGSLGIVPAAALSRCWRVAHQPFDGVKPVTEIDLHVHHRHRRVPRGTVRAPTSPSGKNDLKKPPAPTGCHAGYVRPPPTRTLRANPPNAILGVPQPLGPAAAADAAFAEQTTHHATPVIRAAGRGKEPRRRQGQAPKRPPWSPQPCISDTTPTPARR